jgi:hypothetical protein
VQAPERSKVMKFTGEDFLNINNIGRLTVSILVNRPATRI